jgi:hypothetical protein
MSLPFGGGCTLRALYQNPRGRCDLRSFQKLYPRLGNFTTQNTPFCSGFALKKTSSGPRMALHYTISARQDVHGVRRNEDVILMWTYEGETEDEPQVCPFNAAQVINRLSMDYTSCISRVRRGAGVSSFDESHFRITVQDPSTQDVL